MKNLAFLRENAWQLKDLTLPPLDFCRQSFSLDPPPQGGDFGAMDGENPSSIGIIVDRNLFYVKAARIPDELKDFAQVSPREMFMTCRV